MAAPMRGSPRPPSHLPPTVRQTGGAYVSPEGLARGSQMSEGQAVRQQVVTGASVVGGWGGWAAIVVAGAVVQELTGCEVGATLDRLELLAALAGLGALPAPSPVELVTRSQRLHQALTTGLLTTWERAGWRTGNGKPPANAELWRELARLVAARLVTCTLSRARDGLAEAERAHQLAARAARDRHG
jgi:ribonuclease HI